MNSMMPNQLLTVTSVSSGTVPSGVFRIMPSVIRKTIQHTA